MQIATPSLNNNRIVNSHPQSPVWNERTKSADEPKATNRQARLQRRAATLATLTATLLLPAALAFAPRAEAQTAANADAAYNGFLNAYLIQSGSSAYFADSISDRSRDYMWRQGEDITAIEDHWYRTFSYSTQTLVTNLLDTFISTNKSSSLAAGDFSWDDYDDDLGWATIAFIRGYEITGNATYLNVAQTNFNTVWSRGWDSAGGGGIWEEVGTGKQKQRSVLATGTFIVTGVALYQATGNSTYLSEIKTAYAWERANVFNATNSTNTLGAPGHVNEGLTDTGALQNSNHVYNHGLMLESAAGLYAVTGDSQYLNDAKLIAQYVMSQWPTLPEQSDMLTRGLSNFATQNNLWSTYSAYLKSNATTAWNNRRTDYNITGSKFSATTSTTADLTALGAISSVTIQEVAQPHPIYLQTDGLTVASISSGVTHRVINDPGFDGGAGTILDASAVGNYVTYLIPNISAGSYDVRVGVKEFPSRGIWQMAAGRADNFTATASNVSTPKDEYATGAVFTEIDLGIWTPTSTSDKWFRFMITGKNASSSGYTEAFNYIELIPQ